jgi:hypothetical protein
MLILLAIALSMPASSQEPAAATQDRAADLVSQLGRGNADDAFTACGVTAKGDTIRRAVRTLAAMGTPAAHAVNAALDDFEVKGYSSEYGPNLVWLLVADAEIEGARALPRLSRFRKDPGINDLERGLDGAAAIALQLTSYISPSDHLAEPIPCYGSSPRDALDQLVLAWLRGDREWLSASLGPRGVGALDGLLKGRNWQQLRDEVWAGPPPNPTPVGYRFLILNTWSAPGVLLNTYQDLERYQELSPQSPELETGFSDSAGVACGDMRIRFLRVPRDGKRLGNLGYVVDTANLADVLSAFSRCASGSRAK